jgi:hypothetical protein
MAVINTAISNINDAEYADYQAWRDGKIRKAAIAEGRTQASSERLADEQAADTIALQKLTSKGLTLPDCFGRRATKQGTDVLTLIHRSGPRGENHPYVRLRRMAQADGLVN